MEKTRKLWERKNHIRDKETDTANQKSTNTEMASQLAEGFLDPRFNSCQVCFLLEGDWSLAPKRPHSLFELASVTFCFLPSQLVTKAIQMPGRGGEKLRGSEGFAAVQGAVSMGRMRESGYKGSVSAKAQGTYCTDKDWLIDPKIKRPAFNPELGGGGTGGRERGDLLDSVHMYWWAIQSGKAYFRIFFQHFIWSFKFSLLIFPLKRNLL